MYLDFKLKNVEDIMFDKFKFKFGIYNVGIYLNFPSKIYHVWMYSNFQVRKLNV